VGPSDGRWGALPKFDHPPVVEVALGVEFVPMPQLGVVRLVKLHQMWSATYPKVLEQPALPPSPAPQGSLLEGMGLTIGTGVGPVRLWMLTEDEHTLLQVQHDRLILNWRTLAGSKYPSYAELRAQFLDRWNDLTLALEDLGPLRPSAAEATFVNLIDAPGPPGDLSSVIKSASEAAPALGSMSLLTSRVQYLSSVDEGVPGQQTITAERGPGADLGLTVATRVSLSGDSLGATHIVDALDAAHAMGVLGFTAITTDEMHRAWGRTL
jgi:uncharacterized protein (TIGR04255 family)